MPSPIRDLSPRRRSILTAGAAAGLVTATASSCTFFSTDPDTGGGGEAQAGSDAMESPMLTEMVDAGELPPLEDRLPDEPLVVQAAEPGHYGGTYRGVTLGPGDHTTVDRVIGYEPGLRNSPMLDEVGPGVFTEVAANEDGTEYTIHLRPGLKWSDGEPFTAEDVVFVVEDVMGDTELFPVPPDWITSGGEKAVAEAIDEVTVTVTFAEPTGLFEDELNRNMELVNYPKHYAQQFLPAYNDDLDALVEEENLETWPDLWVDKVGGEATWNNPDLPTIDAWILTTPIGDGAAVQYTRNPYYWKTDSDGRQLPYIDSLSFEVVSDAEVMTLQTTDEQVDLLFAHANSADNKPVYADAAGVRTVDTTATSMNSMCIALNLAHKDPAKAELYQNKDFRIGLSHAIDREELITAVWQRQGEPWQWAPHVDSVYYDEEFAKQYTEFDVDLANEHLDAAGVTETDSDGYRTMPDGSTLMITLDVSTGVRDEWPTAASMVADMWGEVGIRASVNTIDRTLFYERKSAAANEHDAAVWNGDGGLATEAIDPRWYFPFSDESLWATPWAAYYNSGGASSGGDEDEDEEGIEEPIPAVLEQMELMWEFRSTPEAEDREEIFRQVLEIAKNEFWGIGIGTALPQYWVVHERMHNVIEGVPDTWVYKTPAHANPETWFIREGA